MRRVLPVFFLVGILFFSITSHASAQTPIPETPRVTAQADIISDFFAWLGNLLFKNNIPQEVLDVNTKSLPLDVNTNNTATSQSVSIQANTASGNAADALKESSRQYDTATDITTPFNFTDDNRNVIQKWWDDLTQAEPTGTAQAVNLYSSNLPAGVGEQVMPTSSKENPAMVFALDCVKDANLPLGAVPDSKCLSTNRPSYASPTPTPTETPIPTPTTTPAAYIPPGPDLIGYIVPTPANQYPYYDSLPYHIPYNKKADPPSTVDAINSGLLTHIDLAIAAAKSKWKTSMLDYWREVYDAAVAQGWNGAFVLSVWIEETGASDACTIGYPIIDFGVGQTYTRCNDPDKVQKFRDQLRRFLNLYGFYEKTHLKRSPVTFEMFLCAYADGHYPCNYSSHAGFAYRLPRVYNCLIYPTKNNCRAAIGYFNINLLPDTLTPPIVPSGPPVSVAGLDKMKNMASDISRVCSGSIVRYSNIACLDQISSSIPVQVKNIMYNSAKSYTYLQCVGFVRASELLVTGAAMNRGGNAIDFATNVPDGYRYVPKSGNEAIKPGDLLIWDTRPVTVWGHIAKVYSVTSNYAIQICEANWSPQGYVNCDRSVALNNAQIVGWVTPK